MIAAKMKNMDILNLKKQCNRKPKIRNIYNKHIYNEDNCNKHIYNKHVQDK